MYTVLVNLLIKIESRKFFETAYLLHKHNYLYLQLACLDYFACLQNISITKSSYLKCL